MFSPFDLETIDVRYQDKSYGKALPHRITRHTHPKARPETNEQQPPPPTGIDYLTLTADAHHRQVRRDEQIGFDALYSNEIPGQLGIDDITPRPNDNDNDNDNEEPTA